MKGQGNEMGKQGKQQKPPRKETPVTKQLADH